MEHASNHGFRIVSDGRYPLATTEFAPYIQQLTSLNPDILFLCSYLNDSVGLVRAINAVGLVPKIVGGSMIGPQNGSIKLELGPLLNGLVSYEYWLPVPRMMSAGIEQMIAEYQSRAGAAQADPLGYYVAPQAYAQMQIVEQAVAGTGSLDDAELAQFTRDRSFKTILGDVKFGVGGGWPEARVLQVQYRNIKANDLSEFKDARTQAVVWPADLAIYPYANAKQSV
jgi:branched-chain amino acid transport system substrate-binding protein